MLVIFGAVPIVYQGKHYIKRYRARKLFEQDFANQIKMTRNGSNKNPENIATATYGQEFDHCHLIIYIKCLLSYELI